MSAAATVWAVRLHGTTKARFAVLPQFTPEERFWAKVFKTPTCWLWQGALNNAGYGTFQRTMVHRWAYEHFVGPIPPGLTIDHQCENKVCVNWNHLKVATYFENSSRAVAWLREHAEASHCPQGHAYDLLNTQFRRGRRYCRECTKAYDRGRRDAAYWRAYRAKRK